MNAGTKGKRTCRPASDASLAIRRLCDQKVLGVKIPERANPDDDTISYLFLAVSINSEPTCEISDIR
jgi:hypothetical protein